MRFLVALWLAQAPQALPPAVTASVAHLFPVPPAQAGSSPAVIEYWLDGPSHRVQLTIVDPAGSRVATLMPPRRRGVNRATWDLRIVPPGVDAKEIRKERDKGFFMPLALPGRYIARLTVDGAAQQQPFDVRDDPRLTMTPDERRAWTDSQVALWQTAFGAEREKETVTALVEQARRQPGDRLEETIRQLRGLERPLEDLAEHAEGLVRKLAAGTRPVSPADAAAAVRLAEELRKRREAVRALREAMRGRPQ